MITQDCLKKFPNYCQTTDTFVWSGSGATAGKNVGCLDISRGGYAVSRIDGTVCYEHLLPRLRMTGDRMLRRLIIKIRSAMKNDGTILA
jgi:hypothetical protein